MQSINYETAKLRWPYYEIIGDGRMAVVCHMHRKVELCQTPMLARAVAAEKCRTNCVPEIKLLDEPQQRYTPNMLTLPGYGGDDD
jgi:hypothetical protein